MGAALSGMAGTAACGAASCASSALCSACNAIKCRNSTATRILYAVFLLVGSLLAWIMLTPWASERLARVPRLVQYYYGHGCPNDTERVGPDLWVCNELVGDMAVYRICFAMALFFLFHSLVLIRVRTGREARAKYQNGYAAPHRGARLAWARGRRG